MGNYFDSRRFLDLLIILADENAWREPHNIDIYRETAPSDAQGDRDFYEERRRAMTDAREMYLQMQREIDSAYNLAVQIFGGSLRLRDRALACEGLAKLAKQIADEETEKY